MSGNSQYDVYNKFLTPREVDAFVSAMKMDIDYYFEHVDADSANYGYDINSFYFRSQLGTYNEDIKDDYTYITVSNGTNRLEEYYIPYYFDHTRHFLDTIKSEQSN